MIDLTDQQIHFVHEYCIDWNGTQAAIRAKYAEIGAGVQASRMLKNPKIQKAIAERKEEIAAAAMVSPVWVLRQLVHVATADPNELVQLRRVNCRHCNGYDHRYQWTMAEYSNALNAAIELKKDAPDGYGGFGFDPNAAPKPGCPECGGNGLEYMHINDTRNLKGSAKLLYAGVHRTKDGIKVLMRDQDAALQTIGRYLGMFIDKKEISGPGGGPVPIANLSAEDLTDDQLAALILAKNDKSE